MHHLFFSIVALLGLLAAPTLAAAQDLVLKRVMLSSGGLGYFEYEATVDGDATLKLTVSLPQVDDVLKSLVLYDDNGGVGGLSLPGREPLAQAFKDLPFDQDSLSSPADLLATLKGAEITVGGSRAITGRIVSVQEETATTNDGKATTKRTRVTLLTDRGLQQFILEDAENLQFADLALRDKVAQALLAIQTNRAKDARTLELATRGQGRRTVRVAYIVEVPVWKASYRLTLPADPAAPKAALQGWATVENLSGQDWKDIELTLVSGRPVAFHQALYEAYYVKRPEIPVEVAGRLMPGVDRGGVGAAKAAPPPPAPAGAPQYRPQQERSLAATAAPPATVAGAADQVEATDAATQVASSIHAPSVSPTAARFRSRSSTARCRRSGWRSIRPRRRRAIRWPRSGSATTATRACRRASSRSTSATRRATWPMSAMRASRAFRSVRRGCWPMRSTRRSRLSATPPRPTASPTARSRKALCACRGSSARP